MDRPAGRACVRRGLLAVAALAAAFAVAPAAGAHATLTTTEPANDAVLEQAPRQVVLRFDEPVESSFGSVRVYDSQARRVDRGDVERPDERTIAAPLDGRLARGTYTVTWRATSADAHPVSGAFVFHVQAPGANPSGIAAQVLGDGTPRNVSVLFTFVRFLDFVALFLVVGGAVALATILQGPQPLLRRVLAVAGVALGVVCAARDRPPGCGRGRVRPRRGGELGERSGGPRDAVWAGLARTGTAGVSSSPRLRSAACPRRRCSFRQRCS